MTCRICGRENEDGADKCVGCRSTLVSSSSYTPVMRHYRRFGGYGKPDWADYLAGMFVGSLIGGFVGIINCFVAIYHNPVNVYWSTLGTIVELAAIGALIGPFVVYIRSYGEHVRFSEKIEYPGSFYVGALYGAVTGVLICSSRFIGLRDNSFQQIGTGFWYAFLLLGGVGGVIGLIVAYFYNDEVDRRIEEERIAKEQAVKEEKNRKIAEIRKKEEEKERIRQEQEKARLLRQQEQEKIWQEQEKARLLRQQEQERIRQEQEKVKARQQELVAWKGKLESARNSFSQGSKNMKQKLLRLNIALGVYQDEIKNDPEKAAFYRAIFLPIFDEIENLTFDSLHERNIPEARIGLDILYNLRPFCSQYKIASDFLKDNKMKALADEMLEHGLPKESKYFKDFTYEIIEDVNTGKRAKIKPFAD